MNALELIRAAMDYLQENGDFENVNDRRAWNLLHEAEIVLECRDSN